MNEFLIWLDKWESLVLNNKITKNDFLTASTSEGLRVTITSAIDLSTLLLQKFNFTEVLTGNINQDALEVSNFYK